MPEHLEESIVALRDAQADALAYIGFGYPSVLLAPIFAKLGWSPPRIMTTAIQFCYNKPEWMAALEGWVGIDQYCEKQSARRARSSTASSNASGAAPTRTRWCRCRTTRRACSSRRSFARRS